MPAIPPIDRKISEITRIRITNDFLHSYTLALIMAIALRNRYLISGEWRGSRCMCLSFDCDLQEDMDQIPSLLDLLRAEEIVSGFALVGQLASQYPMTVNRIIDEGHEILNHSFSHPENFRILGSQQKKSQIDSFQDLMISSFNHKPKGFRAPHLMTSYDEDFFATLKEAGLYDSSYVGHGVSNINDVWEIALTSCPEHRKLSFDLYSHFQFPLFASSINKFLDLWLFLIAKEHFINVYFDPNFVPHSLLRHMIRMGKKKGFSFIRMSDVIKQISSEPAETTT